jgi:hypothetical protein
MYYHFNSRSLWWDTSPPLERSPTALKWAIALGCGASSALRASRRSRPTAAPPAMAPAARGKLLAIGDTVSVAVRQFGEAYARRVAGRAWASDRERCEGLLVDRDGDCWLVEFDDMPEPVKFKRNLLQFVARESSVAGSRADPLPADSSEDEQRAEEPVRPRRTKSSAATAAARRRRVVADSSAGSDSSEEEEEGSELSADEDEEEEELPDGWRRDDDYSLDERARHGFHSKAGPTFMMPDYNNASLFSRIMWWLSAPMAFPSEEQGKRSFLEEMAAQMQAKGRAKATSASDRWAQHCVSVSDVAQWIGCWYYMLAFPQTGTREDYFSSPGFGPSHNLANIMSLAENGHRGKRWFQSMHASFTLPTGTVPDSDDFKPVRCMWESYR